VTVMLSAPLFKDELLRYDAGEGQKHGDPFFTRDWIADERWEERWVAIKKVAPTLQAGEFIRTVQTLRLKAVHVAENAYPDTRVGDICYFLQECQKEGFSPSELADFLEDMASFLRNELILESDVGLGRLDNTGPIPRARKLLVRYLAEYFHQLCGQWRDEENLILAEIAFPIGELTLDQIREMRRKRHR